MLSKLHYQGVLIEDLLELDCLHTCSLTEYCSMAFSITLNLRLDLKLVAIKKTCIRKIFDVMYVNYSSALEMFGISSLNVRRENRSLLFAVKCT